MVPKRMCLAFVKEKKKNAQAAAGQGKELLGLRIQTCISCLWAEFSVSE